jgi:malonyl-CoA O-methyltransferase
MPPDDAFHIDKQRVRASFERVAAHYDEVAVLQQEVGRRLLERLDLVRLEPKRVLDLGAGTGYCTIPLMRRYKGATVIALDIAHAMLVRARQRAPRFRKLRCVCADIEALPFATRSADIVLSNLTLQWCDDLEHTFREIGRVLKPGGMLMFTTFGPDTLKELRASWQQVDDYNHVNAFIDMHDIGDAMVRARLAEPVMDVEHMTITYRDLSGLMRDLKMLGAHNMTAGRPRGLTGKRRLQALREAYELYRRDGVVPASHEVVYGHAWGPQYREETGDFRIPVAQLQGLNRRHR